MNCCTVGIMLSQEVLSPFLLSVEDDLFTLTDVPGRGDCFFCAICEHDKFSEYTHTSLRSEFVRKLKDELEEESDMKNAIIDLYIATQDQHDNPSSIHQYINKISRSREWVGDFEALVFSLVYDCNVCFVSVLDKTNNNGNHHFGYTLTRDFVKDYYKVTRKRNIPHTDNNLHPKIILLYHEYTRPFHRPTSKNHFLLLRPHEGTYDEADKSFTIIRNPTNISLSSSNSSKKKNKTQQKLSFGISTTQQSVNSKSGEKPATTFQSTTSKSGEKPATTQQSVKIKSEENTATTWKPVKSKDKKKIARKRAKHYSRSQGYWYKICHLYRTNHYRSQSSFLRSEESGDIDDSGSNRSLFTKNLKKYDKGELSERMDIHRIRKANKFKPIEIKVVNYLEMRERSFQRCKLGMSWSILLSKAEHWGKEMDGMQDFKASTGWLSKVLHRNEFKSVNAHGEANEICDSEYDEIISEWKDSKLNVEVKKHNVTKDRVYNGDQTGLFINKLPSRVFVKKENASSVRGCKSMRSKDRVTVMVCTAADGSKVPLCLVGKSQNPHCFRLRPGGCPIPYTHQKKAWFTIKVTVWWINHVFWPYHLKKHGNVHAILILDNCTSHQGIDQKEFQKKHNLPEKLIIVFLPPNVTSRAQPADMGMIALLKIGYRYIMLGKLIDLYDSYSVKEIDNMRARAKRGQKGLDVGGKAHLLDAAEILDGMWSQDGKYASEEGIRKCWKKSDILDDSIFQSESPMDIDTADDGNNVELKDLGSRMKKIVEISAKKSTDLNEKKIENSDALVDIIDGIDDLQLVQDDEFNDIMENWCSIEDNEHIVNYEIDEAIDEAQKGIVDEHPDADGDDKAELSKSSNISSFADAYEKLNDVAVFLESQDGDLYETEHSAILGAERNIRRKYIAHYAKKHKSTHTLKKYFFKK